MRVLVTGATGFVGRELCRMLTQSGYTVRAAVRTHRALSPFVAESVAVGDIGENTDWSDALDSVDYVVHAAARVHIMNDAAGAALYRETNSLGTLRLATAAAHGPVKRLVYLSSVKVNGEETSGRSYTANDEPAPCDAYGVSKCEAERHLRRVAATSTLEFAVVRSPLVYGPGVKANFLRLMHWVDAERPLPFGSIRNRRSLVSVWNLCDLLVSLVRDPAAVGGTWMVSDDEQLSTPELIRRLASAMGRRSRLLNIPVGVLRLGGTLLGKGAEMRRLCGSLTVDTVATRMALGWAPPVSVDEGLARTVAWYALGQDTE